MIRICLVVCMALMLTSSCVYPECFIPPILMKKVIKNTQTSVSSEKEDTVDIIEEKENDIKEKIDDYADALDKKIEKMKVLLKTMRHTEELMKANQIRRRNILKLWDNTAQISATKTNHTTKSKKRRKMLYQD